MDTLKERKDMDPAYMWDLTTIYPDDAAWEKDYSALSAQVPTLAEFQGKLNTAAGIRAFFDAELDLAGKPANKKSRGI